MNTEYSNLESAAEMAELQKKIAEIMDKTEAMMKRGEPTDKILEYGKRVEPLNERVNQLMPVYLSESKSKYIQAKKKQLKYQIISFVAFVLSVLVLIYGSL